MAHRTEGPGYVTEGGKRRFIDQNLPGTPGTIDPAESSNMFQEEICNVIELTGGTVAATAAADRAAGWRQLYDAIFTQGNITVDALDPNTRVGVGNGTANPDGDAIDICSGGVTSQWQDPDDAINKQELVGTEIIDSCVTYNSTTKRYELILLTDTGAIAPVTGCGVYSAAPVVGSNLTLPYPSTPDYVRAVCSDGSNLYVAWGTTGNNLSVSKFSYPALAHAWTSSTGIAPSYSLIASLIMSSASTVCAFGNGVTGTTDGIFSVINTTSGSVSSGAGSYVSGSGDFCGLRNVKLVSDGEHVFIIKSQPSSPDIDYFLVSAKISNPATSDYTSQNLGTFTLANGNTHPRGILRVGPNILTLTGNGVLNMFSTVDSSYSEVYEISPSQAPFVPAPGDTDALMGWDGMNVWTFGVLYDGSANVNALHKIPSGNFTHRMYSTSSPTTITPNSVMINTDEVETGYAAGKILFDKSDLWLVSREYFIRRIVNPMAR